VAGAAAAVVATFADVLLDVVDDVVLFGALDVVDLAAAVVGVAAFVVDAALAVEEAALVAAPSFRLPFWQLYLEGS